MLYVSGDLEILFRQGFLLNLNGGFLDLLFKKIVPMARIQEPVLCKFSKLIYLLCLNDLQDIIGLYISTGPTLYLIGICPLGNGFEVSYRVQGISTLSKSLNISEEGW